MKIIIHLLFIIGFNSSLIAQLQDTVTVLKQLDSLVNVAQSMNHKGDQINALKAFEQALILGQSGLPNNHLQIGNLFHQKGLQQLTLSENEPAWESLQEALRIKKMHLGEIDASVAKTLNALGLVSQNLEKFEIAEAYFLKAREIWKQTLGIDHEQYGWVQHNLGRLYSRLERDEEAETCLKDALRIKEMKEPSDSPDLGHTLVILAEVYKRQGKIKEWQSSILRASSIWEKQKGINDQLYYWSRHNLAMYYQFMGDLQKAKSLAWEAVNGKEELLGPDDPDLAYSLIILANIYSFIGELDSTRMLELRAKGIYEKQNDQNEVEYAWVLNNLGLNDLYQKRYDSARVYLYQSLQLKRTLLGEENADYQITAINYGRVLIKSGALDSAQLTLGRVKMYYEQHGLTSHEDYLYCLDELIDIYIIQGNCIQTMEIISKINSITESQLNEISKLASENELFYYNSSSQYYADRYLSCFYLFRNQYSNAGIDLYNNILFHKGYVLNSSLSMRYSILRNPFLKEKFDSLVHLNKYLAKAYASTNTHPKDLSDVENKANEMEKELVGSVSSLNTSYEKNSWEKLKSFLQPDEIAVDFIQFHYFPSYQTDSIFYVAVVTRPDEKEPIIIPLFEERKLKVLINAGKDQRQEPMNKVYLENGQALYDLIWKPIVAYLENVLTIYFSPTGLLNQLNPEAIGPSLEKLMLDRYKMIQLGNMHELFDQNKTEPVVSGEALLLGGITYSLDTTFIGEKLPSTHLSEERPDLSGISYTLRGIENKDWKYLPGSEKEIKQIEYILKKTGLHPKIYSGSLAGEKVLKELFLPDSMYVSPYLIHFSTHGYFFPDPKQNNESMSDKASSSFQISNNPLIRSGLILAGGNYAWTHGHPFKPGMEDGILTAYEISQMDLRNTELVVLSACDTGLGDIEGNEGVYGLQRAFKIAGVKNLIMSLWQVPDAATALLMTSFYKHWLEDKMTIREALHTAQKGMRDQGMEPYEWAGFVLVE